MSHFPNALVIGDVLLDRYIDGTSSRSCPEDATVPVVDQDGLPAIYLGGAGNVAANLRSLGAGSVSLVGVKGGGNEGGLLSGLVAYHDIKDSLVTPLERTTLVKTRVSIDGKLLARIDRGTTTPIDGHTEERIVERLTVEWPSADVVVICDHGKGLMTDRVVKVIAELNRVDRKTLVVDAKDLAKYAHCKPTLITPNWGDFLRLVSLPPDYISIDRCQTIDGLQSLALNRSGASIMAVTLDIDGSLVACRLNRPARTVSATISPAYPSGAGDSYTAAFALSLASGSDRYEAADLAQKAANVAVSKPHTHAVTLGEIEPTPSSPLGGQPAKPKHPTVVLTTGCFDILTAAHVEFLKSAKGLGDRLIVGLNTDASVRRLKGDSRPVNYLKDRKRVISGLACVDEVVSFNEDTPEELVRRIRPDVYVKAGYTRETLPEWLAVEECLGKVVILPMIGGNSTTATLDRLVFGGYYRIDKVRSAYGLPPIRG